MDTRRKTNDFAAEITPTSPLRLKDAARLAFPDGSMSASALRRMAASGRLTIEKIAGKDYTTLADIEEMRKLCRVPTKVPGSGLDRRAEIGPATSSLMEALAAARATLRAQDNGSKTISKRK